MTTVLVVGLIISLAAAGWPVARWATGTTSLPRAIVLAVMAGGLGLSLWMALCDVLGWRWAPLVVAGPVLGASAVGIWVCRGWRPSRPPILPLFPAVVLLLGFGLAGLTLALIHPDFIAHWGYKAERFALVGGIDTEFLRAPWRWHVQADYPLLVPLVLAAGAVLGGSFEAGAATLWSVAATAGLVALVPETLEQLGCSPKMAHRGAWLVAGAVAGFGCVTLLPGSVDPVLALVVVAAIVPLANAEATSWREIGLLATVAAASKVEGAVVGLALIAARHLVGSSRGSLVAWLPLLATLGLHHSWVARAELSPALRTMTFDPERLLALPSTILDWFPNPAWHGFDLVLLALPLLWWWRPARPIAGVALVVLAADAAAWVLAPFDLDLYVASTIARLSFQVLPATLVLVIAATAVWWRGDSLVTNPPDAEGSASLPATRGR